jgi:hypothetical protein
VTAGIIGPSSRCEVAGNDGNINDTVAARGHSDSDEAEVARGS